MKDLKKIGKWLLFGGAYIAAYFYFQHQQSEDKIIYSIFAAAAYLAYRIDVRTKETIKEQRYKCEFRKEIIAPDSDMVLTSLTLRHELPIIPFIGLSIGGDKSPLIQDAEDEPDHYKNFYTGKIKDIYLEYSHFICKVEAHKISLSE